MSNAESSSRIATDNNQSPAFLVFDTESVPDGKLLSQVKYPEDNLAAEEAILRAQCEARAISATASDFLPVSFQYPIAVSVVRVAPDFRLQQLTCLDAPLFRPREIVNLFWRGVCHYGRAKLVTFNGRGFDLPLMELAAFRYGCSAGEHFARSRNRYNGHLDLCDWLVNFGAYRLTGGLNLLSKILGKPGKMEISGDQVYGLYTDGKIQDINDYCMFDALDTYFVFLRTRVLTGDLTLDQEQEVVNESRHWLEERASQFPALKQYLANWGDWVSWP